jgi:molybdate transport system ATP-binding protein
MYLICRLVDAEENNGAVVAKSKVTQSARASRHKKTPSIRNQPLISLSNCSVILGKHAALDEVSFTLNEGERWALIGANGAGKSVLLKVLRGDMWPTATGREQRQYYFEGELSTAPAAIKQHIAYLAPERQDKYVRYDWNLTVTQVVTSGLFDEDIPLSKPTAAQHQRVLRLLKRFKLWSLRERRILSLSYGQRRRVLLARLLVAQPPVLLLDEVFNGLDAASRTVLRHLLEGTRAARTWVLATHSADDVPDTATHLAELRMGRLVYAGPIKADHRQWLARNAHSRHRLAEQRANRLSIDTKLVLRDEALVQLKQVNLFRDYRPVLRDVNWTITRSEHWAILGGNGSGKSTLLMLLYGDLHPALGGQIQRSGMQSGTPIAEWKHRVGFVSPELQADHFKSETLEQVVASGRYASVGLNAALTAQDRRIARQWLKFFDIDHLHARGVREVSYGQLRLALIARAMVNTPELLLLDEPFTGLDPEMHAYAFALVQRLARQGTQLIMAVHDGSDIVPAIAKVLKIERGGKVKLSER